jgi:hypothetical protein
MQVKYITKQRAGAKKFAGGGGRERGLAGCLAGKAVARLATALLMRETVGKILRQALGGDNQHLAMVCSAWGRNEPGKNVMVISARP